MMADVMTVLWKELKEILEFSGARSGWLRLALWFGVFGIFLPLQMQEEWLSSPIVLYNWSWFPLFVVSSVAAGAFAGERERHTLETLLASRLSDRAILFGKIAAGVIYGWGLTLPSILLGLVTVNVVRWQGTIQWYRPEIAVGGVVLSLVAALLGSVLGAFASLRASTARQAQQTLSLINMLVLFVPLFGLQALPAELKEQVWSVLAGLDLTRVVLIALAVLVALSVALLAATLARFRRARLILD